MTTDIITCTKKVFDEFVERLKKHNFNYYHLNNIKEYKREKTKSIMIDSQMDNNQALKDIYAIWKQFINEEITAIKRDIAINDLREQIT